VHGATAPGVAIGESLHRRCGGAESGHRVTCPRVCEYEVGQVADQHTDDPGMPRGAKHSGSVSHVVYSADGAFIADAAHRK
jgi:hypothetical protein